MLPPHLRLERQLGGTVEQEHVLVRHGDVGGLRQAELAHAAMTRAKESATNQTTTTNSQSYQIQN